MAKLKRADKEKYIEGLETRVRDAKSVSVVDYQGSDTHSLEDLRKKIAEAGGEFVVVKNTLLRLALTRGKYDTSTVAPGLEGPTAAVFAQEDEIAPIQVLGKAAEENAVKLKFGIFENKLIDKDKLTILSKLPTRPVLYGQVVGAVASPLYGLAYTLQANLQSLVYILKTRSEQAR